MSYTSDPDPIPLNSYFDARFSVYTDEAMTLPATGVVVSYDAGMPEHGHGMNVEPTVTDNLDGTWDVSGILFQMEGGWQMLLNVTGENGLETAVFDVGCCS